MIAPTIQLIRKKFSEDLTLNVSVRDIIADSLYILHNDVNKGGLCTRLVNIEDKGTMKNKPNYKRINNKLRHVEPLMVFNLNVLFVFKLSSYTNSIIKLSDLIGYFHAKKWFP